MRGIPARLAFASMVLGCAALIGQADALAATRADVFVNPPERLLRGIVMTEPGGTYHQVVELQGDELSADVSFTLPASGLIDEPGPVVVLWQYRIDVADAEFSDVSSWLAGPPQDELILPDCDPSGTCNLHVHVSGPIGAAFEAAAPDGVGRTSVTVLMSVVITSSDGAQLQVIAPEAAVEGSDGGTLNDPAPIDGSSISSTMLAADDVSPAEIPPAGPGLGNQQYDWDQAVKGALEDLPGSPPPEATDASGLLVVAAVIILLVLSGAVALAWRDRRRTSPGQGSTSGSLAEK